MFESIAADLKREFRHGNMVTRLILINLAIFIFINILKLVLNAANAGETSSFYLTVLHGLSISDNWWHNVTHPWVPITSMFLHEGFWHILWNMLYLFWFGRIIGDFIGDNKIFPLYLFGGLAGGLAFFAASNLLPMFTADAYFAMGASGAVMAIVMASGVLAPDYQLRLLLIGTVRLKYVVGFIILLDLFFIANNVNTGGHFAHLGGAAFGWYFIYSLRQGADLSKPVNRIIDRFLDWLYSDKKRPRNRKLQPVKGGRAADSLHKKQRPADLQGRVDEILDKIRESGYESLTEEEKEILFQASKND
ncbi:MAG: rhomboid family intramembrane serine protease [Saprospirales bacterium]|nr:MAG: rhomboid family intramembrane serine protease [Saprospirales bacterium]